MPKIEIFETPAGWRAMYRCEKLAARGVMNGVHIADVFGDVNSAVDVAEREYFRSSLLGECPENHEILVRPAFLSR